MLRDPHASDQRFSVWAPRASRVDVELLGRRVPMSREADGWWSANVAGAGAGTDYHFRIDGGDPRPDPRSPFQPAGVHGSSRTVDPAAFVWSDGAFRAPPLTDGVIYELHVGTFTPEGTFDAAIARLDYLTDLGVTHVELMPVAEFPGERGWGYDGVDLYAPHHAYGGPDGLRRLVDACHRRGLAVLLDVIYNHLGPSGNYLGQFGPYFTSRYTTPWGEAVNLDGPDSDEVRRFFVDNALMWLRDYHLDGLRLDAVHALVDTSAVHFLEELSARVHDLGAHLGRALVVVAESDLNDPRLVRPRELGGHGFDGMWSDDFHHALHTLVTGERSGYYEDFGEIAQLAKALERGLVYDGVPSRHRRRRHGRPLEGASGSHLVCCVQNHDQVGNRARGERLGHLVDSAGIKLAAAVLLIAPFVPMLFQGEEWATSAPFPYFTDHQEPELAQAVREGRRREFAAFGWLPDEIPDPQAEDTFARAKLDWGELGRAPHADILAWYRALLRLRREQPALRDGRLDRAQVRFDDRERWLVMERAPVTLTCHFGDRPARLPLPHARSARLALASCPDICIEEGAVTLPPRAVAIFVA
jgi:maltooligosyltrehalose trehalohydrolase